MPLETSRKPSRSVACARVVSDPASLLCHALQFSFKSIAYYIRRATLTNVSATACSPPPNCV